MSDICKVCNGTGIVIRVDNYGVPDPAPTRCPACVTAAEVNKCENWTKCQHPKCVRESMSGERWECSVCNEKWTVNYDDIR